MENLNIREIVGTDLLDYSLKLEQALKEGYSVSTSNEFAPRAIGYAMYAWVVKDNTSKNIPAKPVETTSVQTEADVPNTTQEVPVEPSKPVAKRGRK